MTTTTSTAITKMMSPNISIWWVDIAHAATAKDCLKASLYASGGAAVDISCAVVSGFTLNSTDSETDSTTSICDSAASNTPVRDAYEASLTFFREAYSAEGTASATSPATKAFELFKKGGVSANKTGWLVKRVGFKQGTAVAAPQLLSVFKVTPDNAQDEIGDGNQPIQFTVPFLPQGEMLINEPVTA